MKLGRDEHVLILGTGLTAVDALLTLANRGHTAPITLVSRRGQIPRAHVRTEAGSPLVRPLPTTARRLIRTMRDHVRPGCSSGQWQGFMDAMRPKWQQIWVGLPLPERRRLLRHAVTMWNLHRHRIAPGAAAQIDSLLHSGFANLMQGTLRRMARGDSNTLNVEILRQGLWHWLTVNRVVNCTGPNSDPEKTHDPFIQNLIESRLVRGSPVGVGLDVDNANRLIARDGTVHPSLFAVGALTKGRWWEITAMPEIARQVTGVASGIVLELAAAHTPRQSPNSATEATGRMSGR